MLLRAFVTFYSTYNGVGIYPHIYRRYVVCVCVYQDALLKFEKLVEKSTRALAGSCELVDPFWQPPPEEE